MSNADLEREFYSNRDNESVVVRGIVTGPLINGVIATVTPPVGVYEVTAIGRYGAVLDVIDNMNLRVAGVEFVRLPVIPLANALPIPITVTVRLSGAQALSINAIAAGAGTAVYAANIIATKIGSV